jgi:hypothetical protein
MIGVVEARDLVERCVGLAGQAQPGTQLNVLYGSLASEVEQFLAQRAVTLLSPPLGQRLVGSLVQSPELKLAVLSLATLVWTFWVLEGKGIWHKGQPDHGWRYVLEQKIIDVLDELLKGARNLAIDNKLAARANGTIPSNVAIPKYYQDWREKIGSWP